LKIGDLALGEWRMLTPLEVNRLQKLSKNPKMRLSSPPPNPDLEMPVSKPHVPPRPRAHRPTVRNISRPKK